MRVALVTSWMSNGGGGVFEAVFRMAQSLHAMPELELSVLGLADKGPSAEARDWKGISNAALPTRGPLSWGYSPKLLDRLKGAMPDLLHVHGLWMYSSVASRRWSRVTGRPYMVTPHGMLDPWAIRNSAWKKRTALWAYERQHLEGAQCLHALCDAEAEAIRKFGLRNPICIVPNSVDIDMPETAPKGPTRSHTLLYLGRLHPKKGLVSLLKAWHRFGGRLGRGGTWELVIAGWDQGGHEDELRHLVDGLEMCDSVRFAGPRFGPDKTALFRQASAFILPSLSEGLPMVVLEAWSHGLPVLITPQCNFEEKLAGGAAIYIEPNPDGVLNGLLRLAAMSDVDRRQMGECGLRLCRERYSPGATAQKITRVYDWLAGRGQKPDFVHNG